MSLQHTRSKETGTTSFIFNILRLFTCTINFSKEVGKYFDLLLDILDMETHIGRSTLLMGNRRDQGPQE